jgi:hypothetical protein
MGGVLAGGAETLCGVTGSGKTTEGKACQDREAKRWKIPKGTLDLEHADDWRGVEHAQHVNEVLTDLFVRRVDARPWTPRNEAERKTFFDAVAHWGGVSILVDGLPMIADAHYFEEAFRQALYRHRHGVLMLPTYWFLVAQRFSLIHRHVFAACRMVKIYRQAPGIDALRCEREFNVPVSVSTTLERGAYVPIELGFADDGSSTSRGATSAGGAPGGSGVESRTPPTVAADPGATDPLRKGAHP